MGSKARTATDTTFDRRTSSRDDAVEAKVEPGASPKRRTTRDGRQPLVVYMRPESIKALKMAAVENETTVSALVAEAVAGLLRQRRTL
jgi:hypothetical protein